MDEKQQEELGNMVDTAENFLSLESNPIMEPKMKIDALKHGLTVLRDRLKKLYIELTGEDRWTE